MGTSPVWAELPIRRNNFPDFFLLAQQPKSASITSGLGIQFCAFGFQNVIDSQAYGWDRLEEGYFS